MSLQRPKLRYMRSSKETFLRVASNTISIVRESDVREEAVGGSICRKLDYVQMKTSSMMVVENGGLEMILTPCRCRYIIIQGETKSNPLAFGEDT